MSSDPSIVKLTGVVISHPHLFTPKIIADGKDLKYSCSLILPKGYDMAPIAAARAEGIRQKNLTGKAAKRHTISKVDEEGHKFLGHFRISTTNFEETPSQVLNPDLSPITNPSLIFGGCIVDAVVRFSGYTTGKGGVRCESKVIVLRDNSQEALIEGGHVNAEDYFTAVEGAPAQSQKMQPASTSGGDAASVGEEDWLDDDDDDFPF